MDTNNAFDPFDSKGFLHAFKDKPRSVGEAINLFKAIFSYTPRVGVFGDTGVGKSSLCNALFGKDVAATSDVEACTREAQEIELGDGNIVLIDVPGVGEDPERHKEYVQLYARLMPKLDIIIWAIKADDRKFMSAMDVYENIVKPLKVPTVFALTQADKIEPYREWDTTHNIPGPTQQANINKKIIDVSKRFDISADLIVPVSSSDKYNLTELMNKIVERTPKSKRASIVRESIAENVSKRAEEYAKSGTWDTIKEWAGNAWDNIKDALSDNLGDVIKAIGKSVLKKIPFIGSFF